MQAVLTSSGVNIGLAVIYPAFDAVGDRWPWWNPKGDRRPITQCIEL